MKKITILLIAILLFASCNNNEIIQETREIIRQVRVLEINGNGLEMQNNILGKVKSQNVFTVTPKIPGRIININVKNGDEVNKNDILIVLEDEILENSIKSTQKTYNDMLINYNLTSELLDKNIKDADIGINNIKLQITSLENNLEDAKNISNISETSNEDSIKALEIQLNNAKINLENTKKSKEQTLDSLYTRLDNMKTTLETLERSKEQTIKSFEDQKKILIESGIDDVDKIIEYLDSILGVTDEKKNDNNAFEVYLGLNDRQTKFQASSDLRKLINMHTNIIKSKDEVLSMLRHTKETLDNTYVMLQNSIHSDTNFPLNMLNSFKSTVAGYQAKILGSINALENIDNQSQSTILEIDRQIQMQTDAINLLQTSDINQTTLSFNTQIQNQKDGILQIEKSLSQAKSGIKKGDIAEDSNIKNLENQIKMAKNSLKSAQESKITAEKNKQTQLKNLQIQIDNTKFQLEALNLQKDNLTIKSQVKGRITNKNANIGDLVGPTSVLMQIITDNQTIIDVYLNENELEKFDLNNIFVMHNNKKYKGILITQSPDIDPMSRKTKLEIGLKDTEISLPVGANVNVFFNLKNDFGIWVPLNSVVLTEIQKYVFVVEDNKAKRRDVILGDVIGSNINIKAGLNMGDKVIIFGQNNVIEGEKIEIIK